MRNIKRTVKEAIDRVVENFDFEYYVSDAIESMNIEDIIHDRLANKKPRLSCDSLGFFR